jgi:hypothetical protein
MVFFQKKMPRGMKDCRMIYGQVYRIVLTWQNIRQGRKRKSEIAPIWENAATV